MPLARSLAPLFASLFVFLSLLSSSCKAPAPGSEPPRIPQLLAEAQYARETVELSVELVAHLPDPIYKADRLNPDRYKPGDLTFGCAASCPPGLVVNAKTGVVKWTPDYGQLGLWNVTFTAASGIFQSSKEIPIVVYDVDRPPAAPSPTPLFNGKEGKHLAATLSAKDPDGDPVHYSCASNCSEGLSVEDASGNISWDPDFFSSGTHRVTMRATSRPETRAVTLAGLPAGSDEAAVRLQIEKLVINRAVSLATDFDVLLVIEDSPRPPVIAAVADQSVRELQALRFSVSATDPDLTSMHFACTDSCPAGLAIDKDSGVVSWTPAYDQHGKYTVDFSVIKNGKEAGKASVKITVLKKYRAPYFLGSVPPQSGTEASLLTFTLPGRDDDKEASLGYSCTAGCPDGLLVAGSSGLVSWLPSYEQSGSYNPTFTMSDGSTALTISVSITIANTDRAPYFVGAPTQLTIPAGLATRYNLIGQDDDKEDVGKLRFHCVKACPLGLSIGLASGQIQWLPSYTQNGEYDVTFEVVDSFGLAASAVVHFTVTKIAHAPRWISQIAVQGLALHPLTFTLQAMNVDGDPVRYSCQSGCPDGLALDTVSGVVTWTPAAQQHGAFTVTFAASSSPAWDQTITKSSTTVAQIFVQKFSRPPTLQPPSDLVVYEAGHLDSSYLSEVGHGVDFTLLGNDPNGDPLSYICSANCPPGLQVNVDSGEVTWTPAYGQAKAGDAPYQAVEFAVSNGDFLVKAPRVNITVRKVNRPPLVQTPVDVSVFEGGHFNKDETSPLGYPLSFRIQASDPQHYALVYSCASGCPLGLQVDPGTGLVSWTPAYCRADESGCTPQDPNNTAAQPADAPYGGVVFRVDNGVYHTDTAPINITVKNVARSPTLNQVQAQWVVNEGAHVTSDENSDTTAPLAIPLQAVSPDGSQLSYSCVLNCPLGLAVDSGLGVARWTPAYCNPGEVGSTGLPCTPQVQNNSAAKPGNLPYGGIIFAVTDSAGLQSFSNAVSVQVVNVDRSAVFTAPLDQSVAEGNLGGFTLSAVDPDGDPVSFSCKNVVATGRGDTSSCLLGTTYPSSAGPSNFGRTQWLRLAPKTGVVQIGTPASPVGYFDAQRHNAPYLVNWQASSQPKVYPGAIKVSSQPQNIVIVNVDRTPPLGSAPPGVGPCADGSTPPAGVSCGFGPYVKCEDGSDPAASGEACPAGPISSGSLPIVFNLASAGNDPDSFYGEFNDMVEYACDPSGPDGCPPELTVQQNCTTLCDYGLNPGGCPAGSPSDQALQCSSKGNVTFTPTFATAKPFNAPYQVRFKVVSTPDGFLPGDQPGYPPLASSLLVTFEVHNTDHPPTFDRSVPPSPLPAPLGDSISWQFQPDYQNQGVNPSLVSVIEPCGDPPVGVSYGDYHQGSFYHCLAHGLVYPKTLVLSASDPDVALNRTPAVHTEEAPSYALLGCRDPLHSGIVLPDSGGNCPASDPLNTGLGQAGCLRACPSTTAAPGVSYAPLGIGAAIAAGTQQPLLSLSGNTVTVASLGYNDAMPRNRSFFAFFSVTDCPLAATGWACTQQRSRVLSLEVKVQNEQRSPTLPSYSQQGSYPDPNAAGGPSVSEEQSYGFGIQSSNPDGDPIVYCIQDQGSSCPSGQPPPSPGDSMSGYGVDNSNPLVWNTKTAGFFQLPATSDTLDPVSGVSSSSVSMGFSPSINSSPDRANRFCTPVRQKFQVMACSTAKNFNAGQDPSCDVQNLAPQANQVCSGFRPLQLSVTDVDHPPTISVSSPLGASQFREASPGTIPVTLRVYDQDLYDNRPSNLIVKRLPSSYGSTSPSGMTLLESPGDFGTASIAGNSSSLAPFSWTYNYRNDYTPNGGRGYATRQNPLTAFAPQFQVCYAAASMFGTSLLPEQCFGTVSAPFSVVDNPQNPYFETISVKYGSIDCTLGPEQYDFASQDYGSGNVPCVDRRVQNQNQNSPNKSVWDEYDQASFHLPSGGSDFAGAIEWIIHVQEPDDIGSDNHGEGVYSVKECQNSDNFFTDPMAPEGNGNSFAHGGRFIWRPELASGGHNILGYGSISGAARAASYTFRPCLVICHQDDLANCQQNAADTTGHVNWYTIGTDNLFDPGAVGSNVRVSPITFNDSDRPASLFNFSTQNGDANGCNDPAGVKQALINALNSGTNLYSDPDGDVFSGNPNDIILTENPGSPTYETKCVFHGLNQVCGIKIGCDASFTYQLRVHNILSQPAQLRTYAGHQGNCSLGFICG